MDHQPTPFFLPPAAAEGVISHLFGILVSSALYGCVFVQFYTYCVSFPEETTRLRAFVYIIMIIETVQTIMLGHHALQTFGSHFGDLSQITRLGSNWISVPFLTSVVSGAVQFFLIFRIYSLSKMWILPVICAAISLLQTGAGIALAIMAHSVDDFRRFGENPAISVVGTLWVAAGAVVDILITGGLVYALYNLRSGFERSEAIVWRLIRMFIETGSLTAIVQLVMTILFFAYTNKPYHLVPAYFLSRLYGVNLLMIQNSRLGVKTAFAKSSGVSSSFTNFSGGAPGRMQFSSGVPQAVHPPFSKDSNFLDLGDRRKTVPLSPTLVENHYLDELPSGDSVYSKTPHSTV